MRVTIKQRARASIRLKAISYSAATKADEGTAEGGTDNQRYMTSLGTKQQIDARLADTPTAITGTNATELLTPETGKASIVANGVGATFKNLGAASGPSFPASRFDIVITNARYIRVETEPSHTAKFRSGDRFLPNGSTDNANGGWWELAEDRPSVLQIGAPDRTGVISAVTVFQSAARYAIAKGLREIHVPPGKYNLDGAGPEVHRVRWVGEGELIGYRTPIARPSQLRSFQMPPGIIPELHLKRLLATDTPVVVLVGDSLSTEGVISAANFGDTLFNRIKRWLQNAFPEKRFTFYNRAIGGARWYDLDGVWPGPNWPDWYTDHDREWIGYIRDLAADVIFDAFGMNDGYNWNAGNFQPISFFSANEKLRGFQKECDIIKCTNIVPSKATDDTGFNTEYAQEGRDAIAGWVRSFALMGNHYGLLDFNRWFNAVRDGRDILDCSFEEADAIVSTQAIPFVPGVKYRDWIMLTSFVSITSDFWARSGNAIEIRLSANLENVAYLDEVGGKLRLRLFVGNGQLIYQSQPIVDAPTTGANVTITIAKQGSSFFLKVNDAVLFDDNIITYGALMEPVFIYANNPSGMTGTFTLLGGREVEYATQVLDKDIFSEDGDLSWGGDNPWNHPTGRGSDVVYAPLLHLNPRGPSSSPDQRALTDLRTHEGVLFDFVTRTYAMRSRVNGAFNKTGPVTDLVLDTAGGSLSFGTHGVTGENIGLYLAEGGQGAHILLSSIPWSTTEGSALVEGYAVELPPSPMEPTFLMTIARDGNFGPRFDFAINDSGYPQFGIVDDADGLSASAAFTYGAVGAFARMGLTWKANDFDMSVNGWRYSNDDLGALPTALTRIKLGHAGGTVTTGVVIRRLFIGAHQGGVSEMMSRAL